MTPTLTHIGWPTII